MAFISSKLSITTENPVFCTILGNSLLSTVPGVSGAGPTPEKTLLTPIIDAELVARGRVTSMPVRSDTPTGCPTPASIVRAMMELTGLPPVFINAGLAHKPTVPCIDVYGDAGKDPRREDAVPRACDLYRQGERVGEILGRYSDLLILGECVPGGTTTALCVLKALGYEARVSSSFVENPVGIKDEICREAMSRIPDKQNMDALDIVRCSGDPMIPVAAGISASYRGTLFLAGGTQMLAVAAVLKELDLSMPRIATTCYIRDDETANFQDTADSVGIEVVYIDPDFGNLGHSGLARYCIGEVKEGMGAGGAMLLAYLLGFSPERIRSTIFDVVSAYH